MHPRRNVCTKLRGWVLFISERVAQLCAPPSSSRWLSLLERQFVLLCRADLSACILYPLSACCAICWAGSFYYAEELIRFFINGLHAVLWCGRVCKKNEDIKWKKQLMCKWDQRTFAVSIKWALLYFYIFSLASFLYFISDAASRSLKLVSIIVWGNCSHIQVDESKIFHKNSDVTHIDSLYYSVRAQWFCDLIF